MIMGIRLEAALLVLVLVVGCAGCGPARGPSVDLGNLGSAAQLAGRLVTSRTLLVVPDRHWTVEPADRGWSFRTSADVLVYAPEGLQEPLRFRFVPDDETTRLHFTVSWDERPVVAAPAQPSPEGSELEIPAAMITAGIHRLTLQRVYRADADGDREHYDNRFSAIEYQLGGDRVRLSTRQRDRHRYLDWFFTLGVTGKGRDKLSGTLFDGPHSADLRLEGGVQAALSFRVENHSASRARFTLEVDGEPAQVDVAPEQQGELSARLGDGQSDVRMTVNGAEDGLFLWGAPFVSRRQRSVPGPIVLISMDTTRRDALSPYGAPAADTPNLQRFAQDATVFDAAYATAPWTLPSHASMFTGLYPSHHGAGVADDHLRLDRETLADLLARAGAFTAGFAGGELCSSQWGVGQGFLEYRDPEGFESRGDRLTDGALQTIRRHGKDPLFLFVNYFDPHALYRAPEKFDQRFDVPALAEKLRALPVWKDLVAGDNEAWRKVVGGEVPATAAAMAYLRAAYRAEVSYMDAQIGRLLDGLRRRGLYDDALIIMAADHGELLGEEGYFSHGCRLDPELVEIPLIVKWPHQRDGRRVGDLVSQVDIFRTVLDMAGLSAPPGDGIGLATVAEGHAPDRSLVLIEEHQSRIHPLIEHMMVAQQVFGLQMLRRREVVWQGGIECSELAGSRWLGVPCPGTWHDREPLVRSMITVAEPGDHATADQLSEDERRSLQALGYVR